ncbi:MAG: ABC transporter ATP-binding protein [Methanosphaera sp.]|nr:ABC transporter ATP-binding protein [Methanosphaera sp.]
MKNILLVMKNKIHLIIMMMIFLIIEVYCDLTLPAYTADIVNIGIRNTDFNVITSTGINMMMMLTISVIATIIVSYLSSIISSSYARDLREKIFEKILSFSNHELNDFSKASLITRSTNDINQIQHVLGIMFRTLLFAPILAVGSILRVFSLASNLSWIILVAFISVASLLLIVITNVTPYFKKSQEIVDQINRVSREILLGIPVIKAFVRQDYENERFDVYNTQYLDVNLRVFRRIFILIPSMNLILNLMIVIILYFGSFEALNGTLLTGDIIAFVQYSTQMIASFIMIGGFIVMLPRFLVSANRVEEVLREEVSITTGKDISNQTNDVIEFKNVSYTYPNAQKQTLSDINFRLLPGRITAIIGGTGSGKSTILNLIPRLQDVSGGEILLNDVNIKKWDLTELRKRIALTPQSAILFSGTVRSNLQVGNADASDEDMLRAIELSSADDFIDSLDMTVAQQASNFSGGQKQRLSIARSIVDNHSFYLFDDCFSALDVKTEKKIYDNLRNITRDSSVLIVSQRISSIIDADEIIVLNDGRIVDKGTHNQLKNRCEIYQEIIASQLDNIGDSL